MLTFFATTRWPVQLAFRLTPPYYIVTVAFYIVPHRSTSHCSTLFHIVSHRFTSIVSLCPHLLALLHIVSHHFLSFPKRTHRSTSFDITTALSKLCIVPSSRVCFDMFFLIVCFTIPPELFYSSHTFSFFCFPHVVCLCFCFDFLFTLTCSIQCCIVPSSRVFVCVCVFVLRVCLTLPAPLFCLPLALLV